MRIYSYPFGEYKIMIIQEKDKDLFFQCDSVRGLNSFERSEEYKAVCNALEKW